MLQKTITTKQLKRLVSALGYFPNGKKTAFTYFYTTFVVLYLMNLIFGLCQEWNNFKLRLEIIRDLILLCNLEIYWLTLPDVHILLGIFERHRKRLSMMRSFKHMSRRFYNDINGMESHSQHFFKMFCLTHFCYAYLPFLSAVHQKMTSASSNFKGLPQISYFYYPMAQVSFLHYCCGASFLYVGLLCATFFSFCIIYSSYLTLHCVVSAFSQLHSYLVTWDGAFAAAAEAADVVDDSCGLSMEQCLREIIVFHQEICSDARLLNKGMETATINLQLGCIVQLCLSLFSIIEGGDKIKYGGYTCFILLMLVGFSSFGQILEDRIARIKMTIWCSRWADRPYYIKRMLLMMMIGASAEIELKPFGLHGLNMQSFAKVMRTVYSLFNVIKHSS